MKTNLIHKIEAAGPAENDGIATRSTHKNYTHVLVVRDVNDGYVTLAQAKLDDFDLLGFAENCRYEYRFMTEYLDTPDGECTYYHRSQGGAYKNKNGKFNKVFEGMKQLYRNIIQGRSENRYVNDKVADRLDTLNSCLEKEQAREESEWFVLSWHSREDLAEKAGRIESTVRGVQIREYRVEKINGG